MRRLTAALLAMACAAVLVSTPAHADKPRVKNNPVAWQQLTQETQVWLFGSKVRLFECAVKPAFSTLALKKSNSWIVVARSAASLDARLCPDTAPFAMKYEFTLSLNGEQDLPGTQAKLIFYRLGSAQAPRYGSAAVYAEVSALSEDQNDGNSPSQGQSDESDQPSPTLSATIQVQPKPLAAAVTPSPSATSSAAGWSGCVFNGVTMYGRVMAVSAGARFKIRLVSLNAALQIRSVKRQPVRCGEWQFVSSKPNFTVQIVSSGEDFTVSLSGNRSGVTK